MKILNSTDSAFWTQIDHLLDRETEQSLEINQAVEQILLDVKNRRDQALVELTARFDRVEVECASELEVSAIDIQQALKNCNPILKDALKIAAQRIKVYHQHQCVNDWSYTDESGAELGQKITALDRVGLYVPGGKAAYPSSVLMSAIPARVAGVDELIMTVPAPDNLVNQDVLAAAAIAGVDRIFKIGGAQAIAALAYGTHVVPKVDKIVGPGNAYVATAKRMVFGEVGIDMIAGPSEVLVVSDDSVDPQWVAMDLFAQAEHDEMAQSIHMTVSKTHHQAVIQSIKSLLTSQPRRQIIETALANHGAFILADNNETVIKLINKIAAEHLELLGANADELLPQIRHAGAIFVGKYSAEALGDYCAGPNHILPTSGTARFSSPLGVYDFQKRSSVIRFDQTSSKEVAKTAAIIADAEGLMAHKQSALYRLEKP